MRTALALAVALVALAASALPAHAGTYDVWSCRLPDGKAAPLEGWRFQGWGKGANQCPHFGFSAVFPTSGLASGATSGWEFIAPPDLAIAGYELHRSARAASGGDGSFRAYGLYHDVAQFDPLVTLFEYCVPYMQGCWEIGKPYPAADPMDPTNHVARGGLNAKRLILQMECRFPGTQGPCGPTASPGALAVARARISLNDAQPPVLDPPSGPLVTAGALLEGVQAVSLSARDEGGGLERIAVIADGATVMEQSLADVATSCRPPFVKVVPCVTSASRTLAFDTATLPNGEHSIQIAAVDVGGNRTLSAAIPVTTMNGATPNGSGASRRAQLVARFADARPGRAAARTTVGFRGRRAIKGRLTDAGGAPIAGAVLDVMRRPLRRGAKPRKEGTVTTRSNGRFRYKSARGPSRRLVVEYRAFSLDPAPAALSTLTLNVRAGIRLKVVPRRTTSRGTIRFSGKLVGGPGRGGVQVTLYAVGRAGRARVPVSVLRTGERGRFRFKYRFRRTFAPFTYRFQARIEKQPTYPYAAAGSNRAVVRVVR